MGNPMRMAAPGAAEFVPDTDDLTVRPTLLSRARAATSTATPRKRCSEPARPQARVVLVGEQPGDQEDKAGQPFVGPAGRLLDKALDVAGIDRDRVYVTNAVKHFKFEERGKRRIHKTPSRTEVVACQPWLLTEINAIQPDVVVLLGATAAKSLMGSSFRLTDHRGEAATTSPGPPRKVDLDVDPQMVATVHPSAILRGRPEDRDKAFDALVADLRVVADYI